jgi:hypothetical protein
MDWQRMQHLAGINEDTSPDPKAVKDRRYDGVDATDVSRVKAAATQSFSQLTFGCDALRDHLSAAMKDAREYKRIVGSSDADGAPSKLAAFDSKVQELRDWAQKMIDEEYGTSGHGSDR